jgi:hypothetical protein
MLVPPRVIRRCCKRINRQIKKKGLADAQAELAAWQRASANSLGLVERLAQEGAAEEAVKFGASAFPSRPGTARPGSDRPSSSRTTPSPPPSPPSSWFP